MYKYNKPMKNHKTLKRTLAGSLAFMAMLIGIPALAHADSPTVTKVYRTYNSYRYTVTADSGKITASPTQGDPTSTGGCVLNYVKTRRSYYVDGATCTSLGTVTFTSPDFPVCETPFNIYQSGVVIYTDLLNAPCPPPAPPAINVSNTGTVITFTNPASVSQSTYYTTTIPSLSTTYTSSDPFTYQTSTQFAGIGLNKYVYYQATIGVTLNPGQTITLTQN